MGDISIIFQNSDAWLIRPSKAVCKIKNEIYRRVLYLSALMNVNYANYACTRELIFRCVDSRIAVNLHYTELKCKNKMCVLSRDACIITSPQNCS